VILCVPLWSKGFINHEDTEKDLFASDSQAINADGGRSYCSHGIQGRWRFRKYSETFLQITCDGDLLDREGQFTAGDPQPGSASGIIAGDEICAVARNSVTYRPSLISPKICCGVFVPGCRK